jgi:hypothetical protein
MLPDASQGSLSRCPDGKFKNALQLFLRSFTDISLVLLGDRTGLSVLFCQL